MEGVKTDLGNLFSWHIQWRKDGKPCEIAWDELKTMFLGDLMSCEKIRVPKHRLLYS